MSGTDADSLAATATASDTPGDAVDAYLRRLLDQSGVPARLHEALEYALMGGGKRLRPRLALHNCEAVGGEREAALPAAAALELVHTFSLVHDDLPAMDDDALRRGRPTLHKHADEATAILAGDGMIVLAFHLLSQQVADPTLAARLIGELSEAGLAMIAGQVYDTLPSDEGLASRDRLDRIHRHKTAALIRAACRMGGLSGEASETQLSALTAYGESIGLMFQAVDDLLDVTQSAETVGKTTQKDAEQGKLTYPGLIGVDATRREIERLRQAAHDALNSFDERAKPLRLLCDDMAQRDR